MALLRVSSSAIGEEADLGGAVGRGDGAVPHGAALVRFAEAATRGTDDLLEAREALRETFAPASPDWRRTVVARGLRVVEQGLGELRTS